MKNFRKDIWIIQPGHTVREVGILPSFIDKDDDRPLSEQIGEKYISGWKPMSGEFELCYDETGKIVVCSLEYPDDPHYDEIARYIHRDEILVFCRYAVTAVMNMTTGKFEIVRLD